MNKLPQPAPNAQRAVHARHLPVAVAAALALVFASVGLADNARASAPSVRAPAKPAKPGKSGKSGKSSKRRDAPQPPSTKGAKPPNKPRHTKPPASKVKRPPRLVRPAAPRGDAKRGKAVFTALKCTLCHAVEAQGIGKKGGPGTPPDLSTVGRRYTANALRSWLRQHPDHRGHKHPYPFTGTPQQLEDLIAWLLTLR